MSSATPPTATSDASNSQPTGADVAPTTAASEAARAEPATAPTEPPEGDADAEDAPIDIAECMAAATRHFALKQWSLAAEQASYAIEAIEKQHGELSKESADALMLYGKAALQNAISQSAVLGGGNAKAEQTEEAVQQAVGSSSSATNPQAVAASWKFSFGGDAEDDDDEEGAEGDDEDGGDEAMMVDRDDELEGAYSAFEMVRAIWSRDNDGSKETQIKIAEAQRMCGEVERESEKFDLAIKEYESALAILTSVLEPSNRTLSELHMLIALAYDMIPDSVPQAVHHAEQSKAVLLTKLAELEKAQKEGGDAGAGDDRVQKEIIDIKELIGELEEKIEDLKFVPEEAPKTEAEKQIDALLQNSNFTNALKSGQVNNLNSLVKKKKLPAAPVAESAASAEKREEGAQGTSASSTNGTSGSKRKVDEIEIGTGQGSAGASVEGESEVKRNKAEEA
ncbi:BZ3500_MvSof-1268-A1-R1_Chr2-2g04884 [Microbotryum saponariae]|uniref:BZ3500_MvSof-1268-A1-R1_Chr2-2g04884 protein n=1 Tax=Microbotryum saponariae TaxID=289078 RepID=A0A2X0N0G5_9BASI|nr:BZ3500_MvSof-1268-A1-R1_Chr2-2g04884 [Microbotryum saponariae]SDA00402.1 BZ3501_MvSof-1269-A2-R1_Chr2-2g04558 [Microbotryum saponariae]